MKYKLTKIKLTKEEKIKRAEFFNEFHGAQMVDPNEFAKQEIFDDKVEMKCSQCNYEEVMEHDMLLELAGYMEIPTLHCPKCDKVSFKPKHIL